MSADTYAENQRRHRLADNARVWLFGYGSLIYLVDFPYIEARPASVLGWSRRFWQGSHDHRGTPENPGRVVTLIEAPSETCGGMAYLVEAPVFRQLDHREKNGYLRIQMDMHFADGSQDKGLTYIATADNSAWLGEAGEKAIAEHIAAATGPSGRNDDYLLELARALRQLGLRDDHVFAIEEHLNRLSKQGALPLADGG